MKKREKKKTAFKKRYLLVLLALPALILILSDDKVCSSGTMERYFNPDDVVVEEDTINVTVWDGYFMERVDDKIVIGEPILDKTFMFSIGEKLEYSLDKTCRVEYLLKEIDDGVATFRFRKICKDQIRMDCIANLPAK